MTAEGSEAEGSGCCGNDLDWKLTEKGRTLVVSGSGTMLNIFSGLSDDDREKVEKVVLPYGLKNIGEFVFESFSNLCDITIPETVESIGYHAFYECKELRSIAIPASVG